MKRFLLDPTTPTDGVAKTDKSVSLDTEKKVDPVPEKDPTPGWFSWSEPELAMRSMFPRLCVVP